MPVELCLQALPAAESSSPAMSQQASRPWLLFQVRITEALKPFEICPSLKWVSVTETLKPAVANVKKGFLSVCPSPTQAIQDLGRAG